MQAVPVEAGSAPRKSKTSARVSEIDLLRFFAAASVVVYHLTYRPLIGGVVDEHVFGGLQSVSRFGYLGVNLFFIISGFVILWSSSERTSTEFVISRVARLYPSFWTCVLITASAIALLDPPHAVSIRTLLANLTMLPGAFSAPSVDGVYWTLAVELKFYFIIYVLLLSGAMRNVERWLAVWLVLYAICATGKAPHALEVVAMFPLGAYFISGCLFFLIRSRGPSRFRIAALVVACLFCLADVRHEQTGFMQTVDTGSTIVVMSAVAAFHMLLAIVALVPEVLPQSTIWYLLGSLTYPLYLLHARISKLLARAFDGSVPFGLSVVLQFTIAFLLAAIVAAAVERRVCSRLQRFLMDRWRRTQLARPNLA